MNKILLTKSGLCIGCTVSLADGDYVIDAAAGSEITFVEEESQYPEQQNKDSNPIIYGKRRFLVTYIPKNNFEKEFTTHKYIKYKIGIQYPKRSKQSINVRRSIKIGIKKLKYNAASDMLIDSFTWGAPMEVNNFKEEKRYNKLLEKGKWRHSVRQN